MNLIIDVGNTLVKLAVFKGDKLIDRTSVQQNDLADQVEHFKNAFPSLKRAIVSSVGRLSDEDVHRINHLFDLLELNSETKLPFSNFYKTPKTLGVDRMALVSASVDQFPENNVLIIDAGTCITYDFINSENEYLGGAISPGLRMRYKSLNNLTANLPLLKTTR